MTEIEYNSIRDFFVRIVKGKYPVGYKRLKELNRIKPGNNTADQEFTFNEVVLLLMQYLNIKLEGQEPIQKNAVFNRILNDIISWPD